MIETIVVVAIVATAFAATAYALWRGASGKSCGCGAESCPMARTDKCSSTTSPESDNGSAAQGVGVARPTPAQEKGRG
jgi:hypothetical protein